MADKRIVLIGTKRGLFVGTAPLKGGALKISGPHLPGEHVNAAVLDQRGSGTPSLYVAANSWHWGASVNYSRNFGESWDRAKQQPRFKEGAKLAVSALWQLQTDGPDHPDCLYAGTDPAALFRSSDRGETWVELTGLSNHETREKWQPGAGGLCLHTILVDPVDSNHLTIGISAVGVFESKDRGASWTLSNAGLPCVFEPNAVGAIGSCIHKLAYAPGQPARLYQQNHVDVWRRDGDGPWTKITSNLPSNFGFPMVVHPRNRDCAYVIPLKGGEYRAPIEGELAVYRTLDAGATWTALKKGLPQPAHAGILRDAFASDGASGLYFGTNGGHLFTSDDEGESWTTSAELLPPIYSVRAYLV